MGEFAILDFDLKENSVSVPTDVVGSTGLFLSYIAGEFDLRQIIPVDVVEKLVIRDALGGERCRPAKLQGS